jgi:small subunit ribosomal protein S16
MDAHEERDGKAIEDIGTYDPLAEEGKKIVLKTDRASYWLSVGARPTEGCASLLTQAGVKIPEWRKKKIAKRLQKRRKRKERVRLRAEKPAADKNQEPGSNQ